MRQKTVQQQTPDWIEWRRKGIGSSDAPAIMSASPWVTPLQLWELKTGRREPEPSNFAMKRGLALEPNARDSYEQITGIRMPSALSKSKEHDFIRASLDGVNKHARIVLEIKCSGREDHGKALNGKIPDKYLWQCVHHLLVTGLDRVHYFSFDGAEGVIVEFQRDEHLESRLLSKEIEFWNWVCTDTPPPIPEWTGFKVRRNR